MKKNYKHRIKGFTMVEILITTAVLSVVMAVAIPAFGEFNDKASDYSFTSQCNNIKATASVMAKNDYMLRGENSERLCRELNEKLAEILPANNGNKFDKFNQNNLNISSDFQSQIIADKEISKKENEK